MADTIPDPTEDEIPFAEHAWLIVQAHPDVESAPSRKWLP